MAILYLYLFISSSGSVTAIFALLGQVRMHSPQSMQRSVMIVALPFRTLIASVGQVRMQWVQPLHSSLSSLTEWKQFISLREPEFHFDRGAFSDDGFDDHVVCRLLDVRKSHPCAEPHLPYEGSGRRVSLLEGFFYVGYPGPD